MKTVVWVMKFCASFLAVFFLICAGALINEKSTFIFWCCLILGLDCIAMLLLPTRIYEKKDIFSKPKPAKNSNPTIDLGPKDYRNIN
jgi:hypothetical protein